jgi:hypothetical protein
VCCPGNLCTGQGIGCSDGVCAVCGGHGQACCPGNLPCGANGDCCEMGTNTCVSLVNGMCPSTCGAAGQQCCGGGTPCTAGNSCRNGTCGPCGAAGQNCCEADACNMGLTCMRPARICG